MSASALSGWVPSPRIKLRRSLPLETKVSITVLPFLMFTVSPTSAVTAKSSSRPPTAGRPIVTLSMSDDPVSS